MFLKFLLSVSLLQLLSAGTQNQQQYNWSLPNSTYPLHYKLHLETQIHRQIYTYTGNNTIELTVRDNINELVLQAENLTITNVTIRDIDAGLQLACMSFELEEVYQLLIIKRDTYCHDRQDRRSSSCTTFTRNQRLSVMIMFKGEIGNSKFGFNKIRHDNDNDGVDLNEDNETDGNTVFGAGTFFEPAFARSVFPCYDEPRYKANVTLSISHGEGYNTFSNMPIRQQIKYEDGSDMITTEFWTTPPIAIYLLAFVITQPYHIIAKQSSDGILHRILLPARTNPDGGIALGGLKALANSIEAVKVISEYFNQSYVLPKLDHCAFPEQHGAAMENWGLITYKPKYLWLLEKSASEQVTPLIVQNHEILHQWFGNLITPISWAHIWLSEGMATYFSYTLTDMLHPNHNVKYLFDKTCYSSFSKSPKEAIASTIEKREDLMKYFSAIMYDRAPCVLRMFSHAIGQDLFQKALTKYIQENKYGNVASDSLTSAIQTTILSDLTSKNKTWIYDITTIMNSWLEQSHYPIVNVQRNTSNNMLYISQKSFNTSSNQLWWLPLTFETTSFRLREKTDKSLLYMPPLADYNLNLSDYFNFKVTDWYLLNPCGKSFYPVNYDADNWRRLIKALQMQPLDFPRLTRISLMRNLWFACSMQILEDPLILIEFMAYIRVEPDLFVIQQIAEPLIDAHIMIFERSEYDELYKKFMLSILESHNHSIASVLIDENSSSDLIELKFFYIDLGTKMQLNYNEFKQKLDNCLNSNITEDVFDCWRSLALMCNVTQYELLLNEVYQIKSTEDTKQCEGKLQYMAHSLVSAHTVDHNIIWIKLEQNFNEVLDQKVCDMKIWAQAILEKAHKIELRYLTKVFKAVDLYDLKIDADNKTTLKQNLLRKRKENLLTPVAGLRHWFFDHVNHKEMSQFLIEQINDSKNASPL